MGPIGRSWLLDFFSGVDSAAGVEESSCGQLSRQVRKEGKGKDATRLLAWETGWMVKY